MDQKDARRMAALAADHEPDAIRRRLARKPTGHYLGDAVLGGIDGCVTTFAVVGAAAGAGFPARVSLVIGLANLLADGFSMAVSNYQGTQSRRDVIERSRREEMRHIEHFPEGEREEIRQIFAAKGFEGETLEAVVRGITADKALWVETMLREELGFEIRGPHPVRAALATLVAFLAVGSLPLLPFLAPGAVSADPVGPSAGLAALAFLGIGLVKGRVTERPVLWTAFETLLLGGAAAAIAYGVGYLLRQTFGA